MRLTDRARLLPWTTPQGKPCYLVGGGTGPLSRLADSMEATQLDLAGELLEEARHLLDGPQWTPDELHRLTAQLTEALGNVHSIAVSRGMRLPAPAYDDFDAVDDSDEELAPRSMPDMSRHQ